MSCLKRHGDSKNMFYFMIMTTGNKKKYTTFIISTVSRITNYDLSVYKSLKLIRNSTCKQSEFGGLVCFFFGGGVEIDLSVA